MIFYFDYFYSSIVHIYRFKQSSYKIEQYDLLKEDIGSVVSLTMSDFRPDTISEAI